jgi:hypothetical protein
MSPNEDSKPDEWVNHISLRAAELTIAAYNRAINNGLTVLVVDGTEIVEMSDRGRGKVVGNVPPKQRVVTGRTFKIR